MKAIEFLSVCFFVLCHTTVHAHLNSLEEHVPQARQVGEVRVKYLWLDIYDVALYSPRGVFDRDKSFALEIVYLRDFKGDKIAERSIQEIRAQGFDDELKLNEWLAELKRIFPDVSKGDTLVGLKDSEGRARFYYNGESLGLISDSAFSKRFFGIWIGPNSSSRKYTQQLIGA